MDFNEAYRLKQKYNIDFVALEKSIDGKRAHGILNEVSSLLETLKEENNKLKEKVSVLETKLKYNLPCKP